MKRYQAIVLAAVVLGGATFLLWRYGFLSSRPSARQEAPLVSSRAAPAPEASATVAVSLASSSPAPAASTASSGTGDPLAEELNAPDGDGQHDVEALHMMVRRYFRMLKNRRGLPIGDDIDLAQVLRGHNPMQRVFLPAGHPALSPDGHLRDRWGTPYFVHPLGYGNFEIRSAGPDRKMFTGDDSVTGGTQRRTEVPENFTPPDSSQ